MPEDKEESENGNEQATRRTARKPKIEEETLYDVMELVGLSLQITGRDVHMSRGALKHAGIDLDGQMTKRDFIKVCEDYLKVKAF